MTPLIGISGRQIKGHQYPDAPRPLLDSTIDLHWAEYAEKVAEAGALPVQIPMVADPEGIVERLDGLVLSGGTDVEPQAYRASPGPNLWAVEPERDRFELALLSAAVNAGIPVLGICRGIQLVNVHFGGTLLADLPPDSGDGHSSMAYPRHVARHEVTFQGGSTLSGLYGASTTTNSFHHQAVDRVGEGLVVTARSADGVIEGLEHPDLPILAVQWHPEMMRTQEPIWSWLVDSAAAD